MMENKDDNEQPQVYPNQKNEIGSPLNTGGKSGAEDQSDESESPTNIQNGKVADSDTGDDTGVASGETGKTNEDEKEFSGNNDADSNRTTHPGRQANEDITSK